MTIYELNNDQLETLKIKLFYDFNELDIGEKDKRKLMNYKFYTEVPKRLVYKYFKQYHFVKEDF